MAEQAGSPGLESAICRHCSQPIQRWPGQFWKHKRNQRERCMPGHPRNASMATPPGGWRGQ